MGPAPIRSERAELAENPTLRAVGIFKHPWTTISYERYPMVLRAAIQE
jgi:hypothetical protein